MHPAIFILHFEDGAKTNRCLDSLLDQAKVAGASVIVVDNGSQVPYKSPKGKRIKVHRIDQNQPLIEAFNLAMKANPADVYLNIINSATASPGMVARLIEVISDPTVGVAAPGGNDTGAGILYRPSDGTFEDVETRHVDNTCWAFTQKTIDIVGSPDCEGHTHQKCWAVNAAYCHHVRQAGLKVIAARSAYVMKDRIGGQDREAYQAGLDFLRNKYGPEAVKWWN